ncbi:MAG: glycosyltransferase family 39 protein [Acidobacteriota bacterium]
MDAPTDRSPPAPPAQSVRTPVPIGHTLAVGLGALGVFAIVAALSPPVSFRKYTLAAEAWLDGTLPTERLIDFSPLYLLLQVGWTRLGLTPQAFEAFQVVLAAVSVALLFMLVQPRLGNRLAIGGALLFALDRHLLAYQRILEPEIVLLTALLGFFVLLERRSTAAAVGAGVLAGLALLSRPTFLPIFLAVPLYFRWLAPSPRWLRRSGAFLVPVALAAGLLGAHVGSPRAPVMNPGTVFFEGNQPLSHGTSAIYPPLVLAMTRTELTTADSAHLHYREVARACCPEFSPAAVNRTWGRRARAFLGDHPGAAFERLQRKLRYALHAYRWHDVPSAARHERQLPWPGLPFSILATLALGGLLLAAREWRAALPFYVLFGVQMAVMVVFYVSARQRLVLLPAVIFFAAVAVQHLVKARRRWPAILLAAVVALSLTLPDDAMRDDTHRQLGYLQAGPKLSAIEGASGPLSERRADIVDAMAAMPWWSDWIRPAFIPQDDATLDDLVAEALLETADLVPAFRRPSYDFDLAGALLRSGRLAEARDLLEALVAVDFLAYRGSRAPSDPRVLLAELEATAGDSKRAIEWVHAALDRRPADPFALAALAALDPTEEGAALNKVDRYFGPEDRRWLFGRTLIRFGQPTRAVDQLSPLLEAFPELRTLQTHFALAAGLAGDTDRAVEALTAANRIHVEPVIEVETMASIIRSWADGARDDPEVQLQAVELLHQHGAVGDARRRLDALDLLPLSAEQTAQAASLRRAFLTL